MKKIVVIIIVASSALFITLTGANSKMVSTDYALIAANNWITLVIEKKGSWGGSDYAEVEEIRDLIRDGKKIGFFCKISPQGFIIVSLRKELAPIKAYSATTCLNPNDNQGLAGILKGKMADIIHRIEQNLGSLNEISGAEMNDFLEINYSNMWSELIGEKGSSSHEMLKSDFDLMNYGGGDILLKTTWDQGDPYNRLTPARDACDHTLVGCVATAVAQVMNFWSWPPYGVESPYDDAYDWPNMLDVYLRNGSYTSSQINAVAEISYEAGLALESDYGCDGTSAYVWCTTCTDVEDVLEDYFRYSDAVDPVDRDNYSAKEWFDMIVGQINTNQPIIYGVLGHAIVCDGWQEIGGTKQYHMNYGWGYSVPDSTSCGDFMDGQRDCNAWYSLDALYKGSYDYEEMQIHIRPATSLHGLLTGYYFAEPFPYRYFNVDAVGIGANFDGQFLQFLPTVKVSGGRGPGVQVRFEGARNKNNRLFTRGNVKNGILIRDGAIRLYENGSIKFD